MSVTVSVQDVAEYHLVFSTCCAGLDLARDLRDGEIIGYETTDALSISTLSRAVAVSIGARRRYRLDIVSCVSDARC